MIVFIDGTYGIGKTTILNALAKRDSGMRMEILNSDEYFRKFLKEIYEKKRKDRPFSAGGCVPQINIRFIEEFKMIINKKCTNKDKIVFVDMALTTEECRDRLLNYYVGLDRKIIHIILMASREIIEARIKSDVREGKKLALELLDENIRFLDNNYPEAIRVNIVNKSASEIVEEIVGICKIQGVIL